MMQARTAALARKRQGSRVPLEMDCCDACVRCLASVFVCVYSCWLALFGFDNVVNVCADGVGPGKEEVRSVASTTSRSVNDTLNDSSINSDEGSWQIFENQVLEGGRATHPPEQRSPQNSTATHGSSAAASQGPKALETMKGERLDAIFRLLDSDGDGLVQLPVQHTERAHFVSRLQDADMATLIVDAMSLYVSTQPLPHAGEDMTCADFKRACIEYFGNMSMHTNRKTFPWETVLAYDKASSYVLPHAATRALQAFHDDASSKDPSRHMVDDFSHGRDRQVPARRSLPQSMHTPASVVCCYVCARGVLCVCPCFGVSALLCACSFVGVCVLVDCCVLMCVDVSLLLIVVWVLLRSCVCVRLCIYVCDLVHLCVCVGHYVYMSSACT